MPVSLPTTTAETIEFLKNHGALEEGHFVLASGRHSGHYVKKAKLIQHPRVVQDLIEAVVPQLQALGGIDVVLSPAVGGIPVGQQVGLALDCRTIYAERDADNKLVLKRGFEILPGERVLLVEDVITTGGTLVELEQFTRETGGIIAGTFVVVNRSGLTELLGRPVVSCMDIIFPTYAADAIPATLAAIPAIRPGTKRVE